MLLLIGGDLSKAFAQTIQPIPRFSRDTFLEQSRPADKIDLAYKASRWYLLGATGLDSTTTVIGIDHSGGVETGWAKFLGNRNAGAVIAANGIVNFGVSFASQRIYRHGGRWKYVATAINVARATGIAADGLHNMAFIAKH